MKPGRALGALRVGEVRRSSASWLAATLLLFGCSGEPPPSAAPAPSEAPPADVAPLASADLADAAVVVAHLETLALPAPALVEGGDERPGPTSRIASRGPDAPWVPEPARPLDRADPRALLQAALGAMAAGDLAALARVSRDPRRHPRLSADDVADAERRFLSPSVRPYWERISAAIQAGAFEVEERGDREALLRVRVGGAAGSYLLRLRKEDDGWYLVS